MAILEADKLHHRVTGAAATRLMFGQRNPTISDLAQVKRRLEALSQLDINKANRKSAGTGEAITVSIEDCRKLIEFARASGFGER